jgi:hypothetical protein
VLSESSAVEKRINNLTNINPNSYESPRLRNVFFTFERSDQLVGESLRPFSGVRVSICLGGFFGIRQVDRLRLIDY